ncbi:hypothetical protein [Arthrobacter glacialis]|uniref:hypothetical protein n=1 Tax=Arthrobacter glacialis TaxID=1664 RepID=UPI0010571CAE|nr:hypothetical protein [Arthrobacter glacialis]
MDTGRLSERQYRSAERALFAATLRWRHRYEVVYVVLPVVVAVVFLWFMAWTVDYNATLMGWTFLVITSVSPAVSILAVLENVRGAWMDRTTLKHARLDEQAPLQSRSVHQYLTISKNLPVETAAEVLSSGQTT